MDEQLKRRLMGAAIVTALAVIFVPMAFEDKSAAPAETTAADIPTVPDTIEQTAIELPKSPEDVAQPEAAAPERKDGKKAPETGSYRIVPLEDAPPKPAQAPAPAKAAGPGTEGLSDAEAEEEEEFADDEGGEAPAAQPAMTGPKTSLAPGKAADKGKAPPPQKTKSAAAVPEEAARPVAPAKSKAAPAKTPEPIAPKPKAAPAPARAPAEPPVAKNPAPKPAAEAAPAETEVAAAPAKPAAPKTAPAPAAQGTPAKPAPAKPAPAKPKEAAGAPSTWVVQAGSFTAEANAKALVEKLRKQNLPANIHITHKESGDVYRVTVGPELNRARAEQMQKQVEGAVGIKGILLPRH
jgi:DedD protein